MARTPDPDQLKEAMWQPMSEDRKAVQRAAIEAAVGRATTAGRPIMRARRRFSVVAVAAALLALPAGMAVAAEGSVPGDALYPVKRVTETVRSWIDDDIVAEHRVDELEQLISAAADTDRISEQLDRAAAEVDRLEPGHELRDRLAVLASDDPMQGDDGDSTVDAAPATTLPPDRSATTAPARSTTTTHGSSTTVTSTPGSDRTTTTVTDTQIPSTTTTTTSGATTTTVTDRMTVRVLGRVLAGPTCPVERFPPDPACADQPVRGAVLVITDEQGKQVATVESTEGGRFQLDLERGTYVLVPQPYDGLLGTAPPQEFVVEGEAVELLVGYDTGIR